MKSTQEHLTISDIKEGIVLLKSGGAALVLQTTAVNFDLLSETEQIGIIQAYAQMLNSLSFPIQIVIRSKRLDITNYLHMLDAASARQSNPLLSNLMEKYRQFVQSLIKQNEVLDKHFFIIIPLSNLEIGILTRKKEDVFKKITTILAPRKEQLLRQLGRVGLKAVQLDTKSLLMLFYDIYNPPVDSISNIPVQADGVVKEPETPRPTISTLAQNKPIPPTQPVLPQPQIQPQPTQVAPNNNISRPAREHPFVVEELMDTI